jgi:hypothetical protein
MNNITPKQLPTIGKIRAPIEALSTSGNTWAIIEHGIPEISMVELN